jgi:NADH:ubiquinone oxidoreductase subunit F (NADH-binding)
VEISAECRRGLVLVSKVIQNLANGVEFGEKEQHMTRINRFIASNMVCAEAFFEVLSKPPTVPACQHSPHCSPLPQAVAQ